MHLSGDGLVIIVCEYQVLLKSCLYLLPVSIRKYKCSPRTLNCTKYKNEKLKQPAANNFISHSGKHSRVSFAKKWATYKAVKDVVELGDGETVVVSGIEAQWALMQNFSASGLENPVKSVTKTGFFEKWVI